MSIAAADPSPQIAVETPEDAPAVEALILAVFGPGRYAKAAERLREGRQPMRPLSFGAWDGGALVGCVRQWSVTVGGAAAVLLGPVAVAPAHRKLGLGAALVEQACRAADEAGLPAVILVGDEPYYAPHGFSPAPGVAMPGPVDPRRVLARILKAGAGVRLEGRVLPA